MGVYRVANTVDNKSLLGSSVDAPARLNRHRAQLGLGRHPDKELQADWTRLGADAFSFELLDTLPPPDDPGQDPTDDLATLLELWLERLFPTGSPGYTTPKR